MFKVTSISYQQTGCFSSLMVDYLNKDNHVKELYENYPDLEGFKKQIELKRANFKTKNRIVLAKSLTEQYSKIEVSKATHKNIELLKLSNTFTVTTGHQLNLFTGPMYFLYKIISAINLASELSLKFPTNNFVPIYWMATEDHDFEEINHFHYKENTITWQRESKTGVGRNSTEGLKNVLKDFSKLLGESDNAYFLKQLFKDAYLNHHNLAEATLFLANELFKKYGLVIINADCKPLKELFIPQIKNELLNNTCFNEVNKTSKKLSSYKYKVQVNAREINLFYLTDKFRERIIFENNTYKVLNTSISFTKEEIKEEIKKFPERFSPNVLMRPVYQETILPNLCYIGGGGEIAYWLEMKNYFDKVEVVFPILLLRNSGLIINENSERKLNKLKISRQDLFLKKTILINKRVKEVSDISINFETQITQIKKIFTDLEKLATKTDKSFIGAVKAQHKKQLNGMSKLEKRLLKAQKRKYNNLVIRIIELYNQLFPKNNLQERVSNFAEFYEIYGSELIPELIKRLKPLDLQFTVLTAN